MKKKRKKKKKKKKMKKNEKNEKEKERKEEKKMSKSELAIEKRKEVASNEGEEVPYTLVPSKALFCEKKRIITSPLTSIVTSP